MTSKDTDASVKTDAPASSDEPFLIGALDSLTGVGGSYGVPLSRSKLLALEEINALSIAGEAATGLKAVVPNTDLNTDVGREFLANFKARYGGIAPWPWFQGSA